MSVAADCKDKQSHDKQIRVSIITPCYNHGGFLNEAIKSALKTDFEGYELIIVDDGSTDTSTLQVFKQLEQEHADNNRVRIIHQDNLGLATARNNAVKAARGEYILPLDADNRISPHYIPRAVQILDSHPEVGVVNAYARLFGEREGVWEFKAFNSRWILLENMVEACSVFRKKIWEECGGYDPDMGIMGYEDWNLWLYAMEKGWKFHMIKEPLFDYRVRNDSMITACNIPENRRYLVNYICNKHRDTYIKNLGYVIAEKDVAVLNRDTRIRNLEDHLRNLEAYARNLEFIIREKESSIPPNVMGFFTGLYKMTDRLLPKDTARRKAVKAILHSGRLLIKKLRTGKS